MQNHFSRGVVLFVAAVLSVSSYASLAPRESATFQAISKSCKDQQRRVDDFMRRHPANAPYSEAMVSEAFALLKQPTILPQSYWQIRMRANVFPIRDVASGRDYSAMDGRLGQVEISCSGGAASEIWQALATKAIVARRADGNFKKRFSAAWRAWLTPQLSQPMTFPQYIQIVETANHLARHKYVSVPRSISDSIRQIDAKIRQTVPAKPMPLISNHQDPKWTDWAKMTQARSRKERELIPSAQRALSALAK